MTTSYTSSLRLNKPDFRDPGWDSQVNDNMDNIDRVVSAALAAANFTIWANNTAWTEGQIAIDIQTTPSSYWICNVSHTSALTPTTFAQDRAANSTYWTAFLFSYRPRGAWTHDTQYLLNDITYDSTLGITGICIEAHISNHAGTINDDATKWAYIVNLPSSLPASSITFNPATSGLGVTNVQAAIDAVDAINDTQNTRLNSLETSRTADEITLATHTSQIGTLQTAALSDTSAIGDVKYTWAITTQPGWLIMNDGSIGNALSAGTQRANADQATLFALFWNGFTDAECPVSGGRGASAAADFAANKRISFPKTAGRGFLSLGNGSGLTSRVVPGVTGGEETHISSLAETASHNHGGATGTESADHTHSYNNSNAASSGVTGGGAFSLPMLDSGANTGGRSVAHTHTISTAGSGSAHNNMQPYVVGYLHIRAY